MLANHRSAIDYFLIERDRRGEVKGMEIDDTEEADVDHRVTTIGRGWVSKA